MADIFANINSFNIQPQAYSGPSSQNRPKLADSTPSAAVLVSDVEDSEQKKGLRGHLAQLSAGGAVVLTLLALAGLSKGTSGSFYKRLRKYSSELGRKTYDLAVDYKNLTLQQKIKLKFAQMLKPVAMCLEASSNMNVFKDGFTAYAMKKLHLKGMFDRINRGFKKVVLKTKNERYRNAELSSAEFCTYLEKLSKEKNISELDDFARDISSAFDNNFSTRKHMKRSETMWEQLSDLHERVWGSFDIFGKNSIFTKANRNRLKSYMTMDVSAPERNAVSKRLKDAKTFISNNIDDNFSAMKKALDGLKGHVDTNDKEAVRLMQELCEQIEKYNKLGGPSETLERVHVCVSIKSLLSRLKGHLKPKSTAAVEEQIKNFEMILDTKSSQKGAVQEALTKIKHQWGKSSPEYQRAKRYADKFNRELNNAIATESTAYEKLAELQMGSAPTDILGLLFPAALGGYLVARAKDKDTRIKNTLTQGIPIVGGIATAYYGTTRMLTGPTNMALGLISSLLLSIIGSKVDEVYKNYRTKQFQMKKEFQAFKEAQMAAKNLVLPKKDIEAKKIDASFENNKKA